MSDLISNSENRVEKATRRRAFSTQNFIFPQEYSLKLDLDTLKSLTKSPTGRKTVTERTTRSETFLTKFEVLGNVVIPCLDCLVCLLNRN